MPLLRAFRIDRQDAGSNTRLGVDSAISEAVAARQYGRFAVGGGGVSKFLTIAPKLIPQPLEPALVDHVVEVFPIRIKVEAPLADPVSLDGDVNGGQIAAEDQDADPIRHPLQLSHFVPGVGHWSESVDRWSVPLELLVFGMARQG
jgi:hypothetical protein